MRPSPWCPSNLLISTSTTPCSVPEAGHTWRASGSVPHTFKITEKTPHGDGDHEPDPVTHATPKGGRFVHPRPDCRKPLLSTIGL